MNPGPGTTYIPVSHAGTGGSAAPPDVRTYRFYTSPSFLLSKSHLLTTCGRHGGRQDVYAVRSTANGRDHRIYTYRFVNWAV